LASVLHVASKHLLDDPAAITGELFVATDRISSRSGPTQVAWLGVGEAECTGSLAVSIDANNPEPLCESSQILLLLVSEIV